MKKITLFSLVLISLFLIAYPVFAGGSGNIWVIPYDQNGKSISWRSGNGNGFQVGWVVGIQIKNMPGTHNWSIVKDDGSVVLSGSVSSGNLTNFNTGYIITTDDDSGHSFKVYVDGKSDSFRVR